MRTLFAFILLVSCTALPQASSAESLLATPPRGKTAETAPMRRGPDLLDRLGINLFRQAHAAECTQEGEICASNEQCCPGLECRGGPPTTCVQED
jgi:hypothetical protein